MDFSNDPGEAYQQARNLRIDLDPDTYFYHDGRPKTPLLDAGIRSLQTYRERLERKIEEWHEEKGVE